MNGIYPLHRNNRQANTLGNESLYCLGDFAFRAGTVQTARQLALAHSLVKERYNDAQLHIPHELEWEKMGQHTLTTLALHGDTPIATFTIHKDCHNGLPVDEDYPEFTHKLRLRNANIVEFGRLAFAANITPKLLLNSLLRGISNTVNVHWNISDVIIECHPRHARFYMRSWGFVQVGMQTMCRRVKAPAVLLHLPLHSLNRFMAHQSANRIQASA